MAKQWEMVWDSRFCAAGTTSRLATMELDSRMIMSFIIRYLSGQTARRVTFALTFLNNDYLVKGIAVVKCTEWHSYTLGRFSVSILEEGAPLGLKCLLLSYFRVDDHPT